MLKAVQRFLIWALLLIGVLYFLYELFLYNNARTLFPPQTTIAQVDVSGLSRQEAADLLAEQYMAPFALYHREERVEIRPQDIGFLLDVEMMLNAAEAPLAEIDYWQGFLQYLLKRSLDPVQIDLQATHDRTLLLEQLEAVARFLDEPARDPQLLNETGTFLTGDAGFVTDIEASLPVVESVLYQLQDREVSLVIVDQEAPPLDMTALTAVLERRLQSFDGLGSVFVIDLQTGEELGINADVAVSGLSVVKIAILLEAYRAIDFTPTADQLKLIEETAVLSGNYSANLLLDIVAGQDNAYLGVDILTDAMHRLGLVNTFIVTPYEEPNRPGMETLLTPANTRTDVTTFPDPTMQTTAEDMGTLLSMIYYCAQGSGTLLLLYPDELTPEECQAIIDVLALNVEGNLIRFGVPQGTVVSHKHGWAGNTHGDAGIVYSPNADYIIVEYLSQPYSDWLIHEISFPILRELSRAAYNYFNFDNPYTSDPLLEEGRFDLEEEAVDEGNTR